MAWGGTWEYSLPFRQTVKNFCAGCNNGWMSQLEVAAQRVLTPLIVGEQGTIAVEDQAVIAMWAQKTALTAMLVSSEKQREEGYGLSPSEYAAFYEHRDRMRPLDASRFWIGRYVGAMFSGVRVTPLVLRLPGVPEPETPDGYALTIVLGQLVLQGLRFTSAVLDFDVSNDLALPQLWPSTADVPWPEGQPCVESKFLLFADGKMLRPAIEHVELRPWRPAAEVPQSEVVNGRVQVPALCGTHVVHYPIALLGEVMQGRFYAFMTQCDCEVTYLMQTEPDGTHCKAAGDAEWVTDIYEDLPGDRGFIPDRAGSFDCKRLPAAAATEATEMR
jgi:hypothetical protein